MKTPVLLSLLLLIAVSCKKKQPALTPLSQGCSCAHEVSAAFVQEEMSGFDPHYTDTDTIMRNTNVRFRALEDSAEYTWYIGSEVLHTQSVIRSFPSSLQGQILPIKLVVKKKPNKICFPNDDGADSLVRYLYPSKYPVVTATSYDPGILQGTFRVKSPDLPDSFDIRLDWVDAYLYVVNIYNYDGKGSDCIGHIELDAINYRQFWIGSGTGTLVCDNLNGNMHCRLDGITEVNFTTAGENALGIIEHKELHYLGRKLN